VAAALIGSATGRSLAAFGRARRRSAVLDFGEIGGSLPAVGVRLAF
jgi:hypothetical protein